MNEKQYRHIMYLNNKILCVVCSKQVEKKGYTFIYNGVKYQVTWQMAPACMWKNIYAVPCVIKEIGKVKYKWVANCSDGAFEDYSKRMFETKEECYNDMRNSALEKMKWNTQFKEDFDNEEDSIGYNVSFSQNEIVHTSYSGTYTYRIVEITAMEELQLNLKI
jgi:hypothetical protein